MNRLSRTQIMFAVFVTLAALPNANETAANEDAVPSPTEIRLMPEYQCQESVVRLGDIAEVRSTNQGKAKRLARVELFPAPAKGQSRTTNLREIQDLLQLRSVNLVECHFFGASTVRIYWGQGPPQRTRSMEVTAADRRRAEQRIRDAVVRYLNKHVDDTANWQVTPRPSTSQYKLLSRAVSAELRGGGGRPWSGVKKFDFLVKTGEQTHSIVVRATVSRPTMVVTAAHPLRRGEALHEIDLQLSPAPAGVKLANYAYRVEDLVGKETMRSYTTGQPIARQTVRSPLLVRRGEVVTVFARAAGVQVRTTARAMEDGSHGQLVMVQSLAGRDRYSARVVDTQEVEVYARGAIVPATSVARDPRRAADFKP